MIRLVLAIPWDLADEPIRRLLGSTQPDFFDSAMPSI
jgi:hypothetical protein